MTKKPFVVGQWILGQTDEQNSQKTASHGPWSIPSWSTGQAISHEAGHKFPIFINRRSPTPSQCESTVANGFVPGKFLTPGWSGNALNSKHCPRFLKSLHEVALDIRRHFDVAHTFTRSLRLGIYNEYLAYAQYMGLSQGQEDMASFWQQVQLPVAERDPQVDQFISLYSYRVAVVTFYKLRFVKVLSLKTDLAISPRTALYPNAFLAQHFKQGSRCELKSRAMESNIFSWYRPTADMLPPLQEWLELAESLEVTDIIKNTSSLVQAQTSQGKLYSHALSHVNFGLFLNSLLINFPLWLEGFDSTDTQLKSDSELEIISCKFRGDFLESMSHSHWLAQENNKAMKWDQILCPDFKGSEFETGLFMKICNELQFLTFLADSAEHQTEAPVPYICKVTSGHYQNRKSGQKRDSDILALQSPFYNSTYDRVVLNLHNYPKNNPHHFMITQIADQVSFLKPGGYLLVTTNKNLFIPSQRERLEGLLKELDPKAIFDMENVQGRGELGNWIYIFRKRTEIREVTQDDKQTCCYFRFTAEINSFHDFTHITEQLRSFYLSNLAGAPPLWQQDQEQCRLEFFQDAVMNGLLIHSASDDSARITHPRFFKGLMEACVPLDYGFELKALQPSEFSDAQWAPLNLGLKRDLSYFMMVDFRNPQEVKVDLHPVDTLRSVHYECGSSHCHYFSLQPKHQSIDPNVLRKYFISPIGRQIVNLTFNAGPTKVKAQLCKILIPRAFTHHEFVPQSLKPYLDIFNMDAQMMSECDGQELARRLRMARQTLTPLLSRHAGEILSHLVRLETTLQAMVEHLGDPRLPSQVNFKNPNLVKACSRLEGVALFPRHPDVYVEFAEGKNMDSLMNPLTETYMRCQVEGDLRHWVLELHTEQGTVARLYSEEDLLNFAQFILQNAKGHAVARILKGLHLPLLAPFKDIIKHDGAAKAIFHDLLNESKIFLDEAFRTLVHLKQV